MGLKIVRHAGPNPVKMDPPGGAGLIRIAGDYGIEDR